MPNITTIFRSEVDRLARKALRPELVTLKKQSAQYRRDIAALKRQVSEQARELAFLRVQEKKRLSNPKQVSPTNGQVRFSPVWLRKHRKQLGLSANDYGHLVGVSGLSIYNWELKKSVPRQVQREKLAAVRGLGKREVLKRLELLSK